MKKYLITGALALVTSATFISCHTDEDFGGSIVEQKMQAYQEVFEEEFGKIDPNQDWGFGTAELLARTRAAMSRTRTANQNLNLWGDPNADGGAWNWNVPPALTADQKTRVMAYFQANPYLTYVDPHLQNFFVQQVYKGGDSPGAISTEQYTQTNNSTIIGSNNMDYLYAGTGNDHIFDFNDGEWNNGTPLEVLNTGQSTNDYANNTTHVEGVTHPDQITLMLGSSTEYIAYGSSTGSIYHTDCCALAGWQVIENWAIAHKDSLEAIGKFGATLNDGWNRSFVGLDYENRKLEDLYSTYKGNAKAKDFLNDGVNYILYNGHIYNASDFTDFELTNKNGQKIHYLIDDVSNQAIASYIKDNNNNNVTKSTYNYNLSQATFASYGITISNQEAAVFNLDMVINYVNQGAYPTENNGNWVTNIGGRDYVFSDWIVTLTPATKQGSNNPKTDIIPIEPGSQGSDYKKDFYYKQTSFEKKGSGRVFCEDLGVVRASDIDFNDIVFDVYIYKTVYTTEHMTSTDGETWVLDNSYANPIDTTSTTFDGDIYLLAGGGTIPASIQAGGKNYSVKNVYGDPDITDKWIVNTIEDDEGRYGNRYKIIGTGVKLNEEPLAITSVADVDVFVEYEGHVGKLVAFKGAAPHKICVPIGTKWLKEREEINLGYPYFTNYVKSQDKNGKYINHDGVIENPNTEEGGYIGDGKEYNNNYDRAFDNIWEETEGTSGHLYQKPVTYTPRHETSGWDGSKISQGSLVISNGSTNSGYQNGDPVLIRRRH